MAQWQDAVVRRVPIPLPTDDVTAALHRLWQELATRLDGVADVDGPDALDDGTETCDLHPWVDGAAHVLVNHEHDHLHLSVFALHGWRLPRTVESVDVVRAVAEAAIAGEVETGRGAWWVRCYRVTLPDGTHLTDTGEEGMWRRPVLEDSTPWRTRWRGTTLPYR